MKRLQSRNRKEADYYGRGTMKGCCQKRLMLMKQCHRSLRETGAGTAIYQSDFKEKESFPTD